MDLLHELIDLGSFLGLGGLFGAHWLEALVWKHPGNTPGRKGNPQIFQKKTTFGDIYFFHGLNQNAHPFVENSSGSSEKTTFSAKGKFIFPRFFRARDFLFMTFSAGRPKSHPEEAGASISLPNVSPGSPKTYYRFSPKTIF